MSVVRAILSAIAQLGVFPRSGRRGQVKRTHELVVKGLPYVVVYLISSSHIEVVAVVHTARQRPRRTIR